MTAFPGGISPTIGPTGGGPADAGRAREDEQVRGRGSFQPMLGGQGHPWGSERPPPKRPPLATGGHTQEHEQQRTGPRRQGEDEPEDPTANGRGAGRAALTATATWAY